MIDSTDTDNTGESREPAGDPVVVIKAKDVAVYVPQKRSAKKNLETGATWPETMKRSNLNQFGAIVEWHNCSPVLLKNEAGQASVNRYFFGLEKEDFGRNLLFEVAIMEQKLAEGDCLRYLELRKSGVIGEKTQPRLKLKIITVDGAVAGGLPDKYNSEKSVPRRNDIAGFFDTPPGHPFWAVKVPQSPSSFFVLWSCRQPSKKKRLTGS
jgi:hypothetical protein